MKKFIIILAIIIAIILAVLTASCGPDLKPNGEFGEEIFVGKFHGVSVYKVTAPSGQTLYIGTNEQGGVTNVNVQPPKISVVPVIIVDGVKYIPEKEAN